MELPVNYNYLNVNERRAVRLQYITEQDEKCYFCRALLNKQPSKWVLEKPITKSLFPKAFFMHPIHLHHNHVTGMTIGAVHAYCNAVLWEHHNE